MRLQVTRTKRSVVQGIACRRDPVEIGGCSNQSRAAERFAGGQRLGVMMMRVLDRERQWIGYRLNILGVRVYRTYCRAIRLNVTTAGEPVGPPRALPISVPEGVGNATEDPLLLTVLQYDEECPGSDLLDVLRGKKTFDQAICDSA